MGFWRPGVELSQSGGSIILLLFLSLSNLIQKSSTNTTYLGEEGAVRVDAQFPFHELQYAFAKSPAW